MADVHQNLRIIVFRMTLSMKSRIHGENAKVLLHEHKEDTGPPSKFRKVDGNFDGQPINSDIIFRLPRKDTQRWNVQDVVSDYTLKYFSSVLDEESFKERSKDIRKPNDELLAAPVLNDVIKKADQVIINKGLIQGDDVIYQGFP